MASNNAPNAPNTKELAAHFGVKEEDIKDYINEFNSFDTDKDGKISIQELQRGLAKVGCNVTLDEAKKMVQFADIDHDNQLNVSEFITVMTRAVKAMSSNIEQEALQAFKLFDGNNDGFISLAELRSTMAKLGTPLSDKEATTMMKRYDTNNDGRIDYKEFLIAWKDMCGKKK